MSNELRRWITLLNEAYEPTPAEMFEEVVDDAVKAAGYAAFGHLNLFSHGPREVEISHIGVDDEHRQKGIGTALMGLVTELADQHGITLFASPASDAGDDNLYSDDDDADNEESGGERGGREMDYYALQDWYERWDFRKLPGVDRMRRRPSS